MSRYIYTLVLHLLLPSILIRLWLRGRQAPAYRQRWTERLGFTPPLASSTAPLWVHAVSVGEVQAVATLIHRFLQHHPEIPVLITTMTPTGADRVKQLFGEQVAHRYCPYDLPWAMSRFLDITQPRGCVIVETELWPNFLRQCQRKQIPTLLANARLSERSARGYARFPSLTRDMLNRLSRVAVQDHTDGERFKALGLDPSRLNVIGSIKFDVEINPQWAKDARQLRQHWGAARPVFLAASTHDDEESQLLANLPELLSAYPDLLIVLVPRHPERFDTVAQLCQSSGLTCTRRSQNTLASPDTQIYLADTMGELMSFCSAADIVFVGGSLIERGGHNPLEPALLGKPVITGLHTFNFAAITQGLASAGALSQVKNAKDVMSQLQFWLSNPDSATCAGQAAQDYVASHAGALSRLEAELEPLLKTTTNQ
ncbi:3-deoxy-D-manno-octulosonic acid transferase [Nitrincola iocasae]|uniref:3-deoxy-D-manno-octulosonic acid transferase n=1 Tax=Nitrincola iocasae TaxID=2614693 RepID=A0A5J6LK91_9GAMM|nr:3-deoxy-D-manno-octulosonic acid transferase [Nitrincola iocasae]